MTTLELTQEEAEILRRVLETYVSDLRMEVADTDRQEFRERLKAKESILKELIQRLS
jgi:hypothetical protein